MRVLGCPFANITEEINWNSEHAFSALDAEYVIALKHHAHCA